MRLGALKEEWDQPIFFRSPQDLLHGILGFIPKFWISRELRKVAHFQLKSSDVRGALSFMALEINPSSERTLLLPLKQNCCCLCREWRCRWLGLQRNEEYQRADTRSLQFDQRTTKNKTRLTVSNIGRRRLPRSVAFSRYIVSLPDMWYATVVE